MKDFYNASGSGFVWIGAIVLAMALTALSFVAHTTSPSILSYDAEFWERSMADHATRPAFRVRPFTNDAVQWLHDRHDLSYRDAWTGLQFTLMFACCWVFYLYLRALGFAPKQSLVGELMFGLSPPVFMAHFVPMYTWDDFWVYLLVPLSIALIKWRQLPLAAIAMGLALAAREVTFLFLPVWIALVYREERKTGDAIMWSLAPVALFLLVRWMLAGDFRGSADWQVGFNFATLVRTKNTLFSVWLACGTFWVIGLVQAWRCLKSSKTRLDPFAWGAWLLSLGYVSSALILARAMETRVMFPPAILLIPLVLLYVQERTDVIADLRARLGRWKWAALLLVLAAAGIALVEATYPTFEYRRWHDGNWLFAGLHLAGLMFFVLTEWRSRLDPNRDGESRNRG